MKPKIINTGLYTGYELILKGKYGTPDLEVPREKERMIIVLTHDDFNKATEEVRQLEEVLDVDLKYLKHLKNIF